MLITFSGLDGSGKTTLIEVLRTEIEKRGRKTVVFTMYDDLTLYACLRRARDKIFHTLRIHNKNYKENASVNNINPNTWDGKIRDPKIAVDDKKNALARIVYYFFRSTFARKLSLFADLLIILFYRFYYGTIRGFVLITDRFVYDTLADVSDLELKRFGFVKFFLTITPLPDAAIFIDVAPELAYKRKGEYPISYMKWRREAYRRIFSLLTKSLTINNDGNTAPSDNVKMHIMPFIANKL